MIEDDGYVTVHPAQSAAAGVIRRIVALVGDVIAEGMQPMRVVLSVDLYRELAREQALEPSHIGRLVSDKVRVRCHGHELVVDCDRAATSVHVSARTPNVGVA